MNVQSEWTLQRACAAKANRGYFRWHDKADACLISGYQSGRPAKEIASDLGCSVNAVRVRARILGAPHARYVGDLAARFWIYVHPEPNSGCWLWSGSVDRNGYGQFRLPTSEGGNLAYASHISLRLAERFNPGGLRACHSCDNPPCVNPDHLFWGTQKDNMQDCMAKGRHSKPPLCRKGSRPLKTICVNGHNLSDAYVRHDGYRACRQCSRDTKARMRARLRGEAA